VVQALIDNGALTEDQARRHPHRSVVLQALDGGERPLPAVRSVQARAGDRLLLCSDGITDYMADHQVATLLRISDPQVAVRPRSTPRCSTAARTTSPPSSLTS